MGARRAVEHLAQLGHRRIAYANARTTYLAHYSVAERHKTLVCAAQELGIELVRGHEMPFVAATEFLQDEVLEQKATAIVTYDHQIAVTLMGAANALGMHVPRDFSLICFNDVFPVSVLPTPLTAVSVPGREMGRISASQLLNNLAAAETSHAAKVIRVPEDLIVRRSTGAPRVGA